MVWKIDRLTRSVRDLVLLMDHLDKLSVGLRSLTEPIDTTTPIARPMVQLVGLMAELERETILERSRAGMEAARKRGVRFGCPPKLTQGQEREAVGDGEGWPFTVRRGPPVVRRHPMTVE
jgi:DNA invertase Pin-like site-specific DNA recombinase